jgi:beta-lactamase class D
VRKGGDACAVRLPPASTFKVPHALIALEVGARTGPDDTEKWDGTKYPISAWDQDLTLASAIRVSSVWYFQRTAKRIGSERMASWLGRIPYGNAAIGPVLVRFWLDGPLAISADEQVQFMERLAGRTLPFAERHQAAVDAMIRQEPGTIARGTPIPVDATWGAPKTEVFAKTGSTQHGKENVRWLVGHVAKEGRSYAFASLVVAPEELSTEAVTQAMRELRELGLVDAKRAPPAR